MPGEVGSDLTLFRGVAIVDGEVLEGGHLCEACEERVVVVGFAVVCIAGGRVEEAELEFLEIGKMREVEDGEDAGVVDVCGVVDVEGC